MQVSQVKAQAWCKEKSGKNGSIPYFETSAKDGYNVEAAFQAIARLGLKTEKLEEVYMPEFVDVTKNVNKGDSKESKGCCS